MLAIYTRISKEDKDKEGISLENQQYRGIQLATNLGLKYKVYEEEGKSGGLPINKRPKFLEMWNEIESKKITTVYGLNQSRLDRGDILQWLTIVAHFKKYKIKLYFNHVYQDYTNIATELTMNVQASANHFYIKQTGENIKSALEDNARKGKVAGGVMRKYGYMKGEDKMMIIKPDEAIIVKRMFELSTKGTGLSTKGICKILNNEGVPTRRTTDKTALYVRGKTFTEFLWRPCTTKKDIKG